MKAGRMKRKKETKADRKEPCEKEKRRKEKKTRHMTIITQCLTQCYGSSNSVISNRSPDLNVHSSSCRFQGALATNTRLWPISVALCEKFSHILTEA